MRTLSFVSMMAFFLLAGCSEDGGSSGRGESCRARNDCESGLRCINDTCILNDFNVAPTTLSCDLIECTSDAECCGEQPGFCAELEAACGAGDTFACQDYEVNCACRQACTENRCGFVCTSDTDCGFGGSCVAGSCVDCTTDADCFGDQVCASGTCTAGCSSNADCPYFHSCTSGECVETGCTTDRECIAISSNPRAICVDSECSAPCESDAECNIGGYRFQACDQGQCTYIGCETDEECRIFLGAGPGAGASAVCR